MLPKLRNLLHRAFDKSPDEQPALGLALGSGASRGWSHVGVLKALQDAGIKPDIVCGTSVGAMVGCSYLAGNLETLEDWVLGASRADVLRFFSFRLANSAFVDLERFNWFLDNFVAPADLLFEELDKPCAVVCTDLETGREVLLREGRIADAVRASMAMPGLFHPEQIGQRWLVDGGLVNPLPVSACRELGADIVIGVNLNSHILNRHHAERPGYFATILNTINIFQDQIARTRLEACPADILIEPQVGNIGMFDFQRAADAIREGETCTRRALADIRRLTGAQHRPLPGAA
jgi:NTE family protein